MLDKSHLHRDQGGRREHNSRYREPLPQECVRYVLLNSLAYVPVCICQLGRVLECGNYDDRDNHHCPGR